MSETEAPNPAGQDIAAGDAMTAAIENLVIAGWTGRNAETMEAHIQELEALGIARPRETPMYYRVAASLLTTADTIQVSGRGSSGEVEAVLYSLSSGLWVGVGSDHTDRELERSSVSFAKQLCPKPVSAAVWPFDDVIDHWDSLILRSWIVEVGTGEKRLYQQGELGLIRDPRELMAGYTGQDAPLPAGTAMFCGTHSVIGELTFSDAFEMELEDPNRKRTLRHRYRVTPLPVD